MPRPPTFLDRILANTRAEVAARATAAGGDFAPAPRRTPRPSFREAITAPVGAPARPAFGEAGAIIAEFKRRSPSAGEIAPVARSAAAAAAVYAAGGAAAVSVLTDAKFFGGELADLQAAAKAVPEVPILRKDFVISEFQLAEAAAAGASAVLLIARVLGPELGDFVRRAEAHGLEALVEVHDGAEVAAALAAGAGVIGVNARDLRTFAVDLAAAGSLRATIPRRNPRTGQRILAVCESGVKTADEAVRVLTEGGFDAVLIGETLMRAPNPAAFIRQVRRRVAAWRQEKAAPEPAAAEAAAAAPAAAAPAAAAPAAAANL